MALFEFIADKELRVSLDSDLAELQHALEVGSWKSVHVLSGSIIETVLIDHLLSVHYCGKDPLKMTLDEAIAAGKASSILSEKVVELSTIIKRYRNLIHPGRLLRLSEKIDRNSAQVCHALVQMVSGEIAASKQLSYGYTAEQVASKVERDASALSIVNPLLSKTGQGCAEVC